MRVLCAVLFGGGIFFSICEIIIDEVAILGVNTMFSSLFTQNTIALLTNSEAYLKQCLVTVVD